ncbi:MAG: hypothetical protein EOP73_15085, partial [Variovorax sp.]
MIDNDSTAKATIAIPAPDMPDAHVRDFAAYEALVAEAEADHGAYWGRLAREFVAWRTPFTRTLDD